ncbi:hypothetical protein HZA71_00750, partial [Candidatus Falkowbacteria bacterium]|nr:hypothetical protein [Candidatus Falkowbacteria bacterium]
TEYRPGDIDWEEYRRFWLNQKVKLLNSGFDPGHLATIVKVVKNKKEFPLFWLALDCFGGGKQTVVTRKDFEPIEEEMGEKNN